MRIPRPKTTLDWIFLILIVLLIVDFFIRMYKGEEVVEASKQVEIEVVPDTTEYIDFTEVMLDKRTFLCQGDVDLVVNEIGVVTFTCATEDEKLTFTLNPVEMFVTRHWTKKGVNDMGTAEEESE